MRETSAIEEYWDSAEKLGVWEVAKREDKLWYKSDSNDSEIGFANEIWIFRIRSSSSCHSNMRSHHGWENKIDSTDRTIQSTARRIWKSVTQPAETGHVEPSQPASPGASILEPIDGLILNDNQNGSHCDQWRRWIQGYKRLQDSWQRLWSWPSARFLRQPKQVWIELAEWFLRSTSGQSHSGSQFKLQKQAQCQLGLSWMGLWRESGNFRGRDQVHCRDIWIREAEKAGKLNSILDSWWTARRRHFT